MKILILEDEQSDIDTFIASVDRYHDENSRDVTVIEAKTVDEALDKLDNTFDGAIIDMTIGSDPAAGNVVIDKINDLNIRIPITIFTGTPDNVHGTSENIKINTKGEVQYVHLLEEFWKLHISGITKVMGGRGKIEELLNLTYHNHILPQSAAWIRHGEVNPGRSENALLRHTCKS